MLWLDHLIFGNGFGMKSPHCDNRFYWLVDTTRGRKVGKGALYTFLHGFGAQLTSRQWGHPKPGERRKLLGREFRPFHSVRRGLRVEVSWATMLPPDIDGANVCLRAIKADLDSTMMEPRP